jgi:hypothetical protein
MKNSQSKLEKAGHFLQNTHGGELAELLLNRIEEE